MSDQTAVQLESCSKTFANGASALQTLSLTVMAGETLALLGPSGCGKTTVLRIIAGLEQPDRGGVVKLNGEDVTRLPTERRQVGLVFQHYALFPTMDVAENIGYGLRVNGTSAPVRERRVEELLAMVRMTEFARRPIHQLSGGQKQRVALARALAPSPRVLLLDEPLTALDTQLRESLRDELGEVLRHLNMTTILVTHDHSEAMALATRIAVMANGRLEQVGAPEEIYRNPASAFVAGFVGAMRKIVGTVIEDRISLGGDGSLFYRPHEVTVSTSNADGLMGVLVARTYHGNGIQYVVRLMDEQRVVADVLGESTWAVGDSVCVRFSRFADIKD